MLEGVATAIGTLFIIVIILYLAYVCTKYIGKSARLRQFGGSSRHIAVIDQMILGQDSSVAIVKVQDRVLLLGITSDQISLLTELEDDGSFTFPEMGTTAGQGIDFKDIIDKIRDRKK